MCPLKELQGSLSSTNGSCRVTSPAPTVAVAIRGTLEEWLNVAASGRGMEVPEY